jgi:hypothetical protein
MHFEVQQTSLAGDHRRHRKRTIVGRGRRRDESIEHPRHQHPRVHDHRILVESRVGERRKIHHAQHDRDTRNCRTGSSESRVHEVHVFEHRTQTDRHRHPLFGADLADDRAVEAGVLVGRQRCTPGRREPQRQPELAEFFERRCALGTGFQMRVHFNLLTDR